MNKTDILKISPITLIVLCMAQIGSSGDNSMLSFATGQLVKHMSATMDQIQMANIVYNLLAGALMIFGGMAGIAWGFKRVFLVGSSLLALGEFIAVIAPNMDIFVWGGRAIAGFGDSLMLPSVLGIIASLYQGRERVFAFGAMGGAIGIAVIVMPLGAGLIMTTVGYKFAFSLLSAWFLIIFLAGLFFIPSIKPTKIKVDFIGAILTFIGLILFIIGCSKISVWGFVTPREVPDYLKFIGISPALPIIILGIIIMIATLTFEHHIEKKQGSALIPSSFTKIPTVRSGLYVTGLTFAILGISMFLVTSWIIIVTGQSSMKSAITFIFLAVPMIIFSLLLPKKFSWLSPRKIILTSSFMIMLGFLILAFSLQPKGYNDAIYIGLFLCGCGLGGYSSQAAMIVSSALNQRDAAQSGGAQGSVRNLWQAAGVAIIGAVFLSGLTTNFKSQVAQSDLPLELKQSIARHQIIKLVSDDNMIRHLQKLEFPHDKIQKIMVIYEDSQVHSGRLAFLAAFLMVLIHIPGFRNIQTKGWTERSKKNKKE